MLDQGATVLKLLQTLNGASSHATPEPFSAPEDVFWGGKLQRKQLIQLCRLLNHPSLKQEYQDDRMPKHMNQFVGTWCRIFDFPQSKAGGRNGANWNAFSNEEKTCWKQNMRELLIMQAWTKPSEGHSQLEVLEGKRCIGFVDLVTGQKDFKEYKACELVAWIAIWLHWYDTDHYTKQSPSKELVDAWHRVNASNAFNDHTLAINLADHASQSAIKNGILFPVWNMVDCEYMRTRVPTLSSTRERHEDRVSQLEKKLQIAEAEIRSHLDKAHDDALMLEQVRAESARLREENAHLELQLENKTAELNHILRRQGQVTEQVRRIENRTKGKGGRVVSKGKIPRLGNENHVTRWSINPRYFALIANRHPRWGASNHPDELKKAVDAGYFRGRKKSEGRSHSCTQAQRKSGDKVKLICNGNLGWLGLEDGDSMIVCITGAHHFKDWTQFATCSNLEALLPSHGLRDGSLRCQNVTVQFAVDLYQQIYHWPIERGESRAIRFDIRPL